jgi:hypothetical protein
MSCSIRVLSICNDPLSQRVEVFTAVHSDSVGEDLAKFSPSLSTLSVNSTYGSNANRSPPKRPEQFVDDGLSWNGHASRRWSNCVT